LPPIIFSIAGPPVRVNLMIRAAARIRNTMLSQVV
jgi:hypothetical protein